MSLHVQYNGQKTTTGPGTFSAPHFIGGAQYQQVPDVSNTVSPMGYGSSNGHTYGARQTPSGISRRACDAVRRR